MVMLITLCLNYPLSCMPLLLAGGLLEGPELDLHIPVSPGTNYLKHRRVPSTHWEQNRYGQNKFCLASSTEASTEQALQNLW